jgi:hypothetical protein
MKEIIIIGSTAKAMTVKLYTRNISQISSYGFGTLAKYTSYIKKNKMVNDIFIIFGAKYLSSLSKKKLYDFIIKNPSIRMIAHSEIPSYLEVEYITGISTYVSDGRNIFKDYLPRIIKNLDNYEFGNPNITILEDNI